MLINNKSVIGFYIYSDNAEYECGDFVVYQDCIYKCTAANPTTSQNTVINHKPTEDHENFKIYPGDMISTADEFFDYTKKVASGVDVESQEDKFVSMHTLYEVLQRLYFGISTNGEITGSILENTGEGEDYLVSGLGTLDTKDLAPEDAVLQSPSLNNGILKISRSFFGFFPGTNLSLSNYYSEDPEDNSIILLRQYTYDFKNDSEEVIRRRSQELIDPVSGTVYVRYSDAEGTGSAAKFSKASAWKCVSIGSDFASDINSLVSNYYNLVKGYKELLKRKDTGFKTIYPVASGIQAWGESYYPLSAILIEDPTKIVDSTISEVTYVPGVFTVVVSEKFPGGYKNYSVTISSYEIKDEVRWYALRDGLSIHAGPSWNNPSQLEIATSTSENTAEVKITNVYFKADNYE